MGWLPPELWQHIITAIPSNEEGARTLARLSMVNMTLLGLARDPVFWKPFYNKRYRHAELRRDEDRRERFGDNWCYMYYERRSQDLQALEDMDELIRLAGQPERRLSCARRIVKHGLDIYDLLSAESEHVWGVLDDRREQNLSWTDITMLGDEAVRKAWAYELLCTISAIHALDKWAILKRVEAGECINAVPFEEAFACISSFHGVLGDDILNYVYALADECKETLLRERTILDSMQWGFSIFSVCNEVLGFMQNRGYHQGAGENFFDIGNSFPHSFLFTHKHSLPISLVFIFVTIMNRLGFRAIPLALGGIVVSIVSGNVAVNVYGAEISQLWQPYTGTDDLQKMAKSTRYLLLRAGKNISHALQRLPRNRIEFENSTLRAHLAACCIEEHLEDQGHSTYNSNDLRQYSDYWEPILLQQELLLNDEFNTILSTDTLTIF